MWAWLQKNVRKFFPLYSFSRSFAISTLVHLSIFILATISLRPLLKAPPRIDQSKVVWTQTVKQKKPTPENKLPPPDVIRATPKKEEPKINVEKKKEEPKKKEPEIDRKKLLEEALAKVKDKLENDRPIPKEDNFESSDEKNPPLLLSADEASAIKASPELYAYTEAINALVVNNFLWYQSEKNFKTQVELRLSPDGSVQDTKIIQSSGDVSFDQATLRALQKSSPFPAPTGKLTLLFQQETIVFTFDGSQL